MNQQTFIFTVNLRIKSWVLGNITLTRKLHAKWLFSTDNDIYRIQIMLHYNNSNQHITDDMARNYDLYITENRLTKLKRPILDTNLSDKQTIVVEGWLVEKTVGLRIKCWIQKIWNLTRILHAKRLSSSDTDFTEPT